MAPRAALHLAHRPWLAEATIFPATGSCVGHSNHKGMPMKQISVVLIPFFFSCAAFGQSAASITADTSHKEFAIENCVNAFNPAKVESTAVGYQYWFVDKHFLDGRTVKMSVVAPHSATHSPHSHPEDEVFFVLDGNAEFYLNGKTATAGPFTSFYCPPYSKHGIRNVGDTVLKYLVIKKYQQ
jgi:quercetin dioxygenase-like cupin family protein